jgi:hypothetical protein
VTINACVFSEAERTVCCAPTCTYTSAPTCGTLNVRRSGTTTPASCVSGNADIIVTSTSNVESAKVRGTNTVTGGVKDYTLINAGGGTWQIIGVNLETDLGTGNISLKFTPTNCDSTNQNCTPISVNVVVTPGCPNINYMGRTSTCGATTNASTFFWYDVSPPASSWLLSVNYDQANFPWYTPSQDHLVTSPTLNWTGFWRVMLASGSIPSFKSGQYGHVNSSIPESWSWRVQPIDGCGVLVAGCSPSKPAFTCTNTAPYCAVAPEGFSTPILTGPDSLYVGQGGPYQAYVRDSIDPINFRWSSPCGGTFTPTTSVSGTTTSDTLLTTTWTPPVSAIGQTCTVTLSLSDTALTGSCAKSVSITNPVISGTLREGSCNSTAPVLFQDHPEYYVALPANPTLSISTIPSGQSANPTVNKTTGYYSTSAFNFSYTPVTYYLGLDNNDLNLPPDTVLEVVCVKSNRVPEVFSSSSLGVSGSTILNSNLTVDIGFRLKSNGDVGWFTSLFGPLYSLGGVTWVLPESTASGYASYFSPSSFVNLTNRFGLSGGTFNVGNSSPADAISSLGYVQNLIGTTGTALDFSFKEPRPEVVNAFTEIPSAGTFATMSLNPSTIYRMDISDMNEILDSPTYATLRSNYSSRISADGVVVIYLTGDSNDKLRFTNNFLTLNLNRKLLFVTPNDVVFSPAIGSISPSGAIADTNIVISIITKGDISFPSGIPSGDETSEDKTIAIRGSLVAKGTIDFSRDRRVTNYHPSEVITFEPSYYTQLQSQITTYEAFERSFFSLVSISWGLED